MSNLKAIGPKCELAPSDVYLLILSQHCLKHIENILNLVLNPSEQYFFYSTNCHEVKKVLRRLLRKAWEFLVLDYSNKMR